MSKDSKILLNASINAHLGMPGSTVYIFAPLFLKTGGIPWVAEPDGCGSLEIVRWVPGRLDPAPRRAWIHSLYVEPSFRRRGIGRQLTETIMAWCRERGFKWIYLHASDQGRPLYESLGLEASTEMRLRL